MTAKINNNTASTTVKGNIITLKVGDQVLTVDVKQVTCITDALLAGRKVAYGNLRTKRESAKAAPKKAAPKKSATSGRRAAAKANA